MLNLNKRFNKLWLIALLAFPLRLFPYLNTLGYLLSSIFWFNVWKRFRKKVFILSSTLFIATTSISVNFSNEMVNISVFSMSDEDPVKLKELILDLIDVAKVILTRNTGVLNTVFLTSIALSLLFEWFCLTTLIEDKVLVFKKRCLKVIVHLIPFTSVVHASTVLASFYSLNKLTALESEVVLANAVSMDVARLWIKAFYRSILLINVVTILLSLLQFLTHFTLMYIFAQKYRELAVVADKP